MWAFGHHLLILGAAGARTLPLARGLTTLLPDMTLADALDTMCIHGVAGRTGARTAVVTTRPCRAPHHTIADVRLIGGSQVPRPGEVSLAHYGVLFLDELPDCRRHVLEACPDRSRRVSYTYNFAGVINFHAFADIAIRLLTATGAGEAREPPRGLAR
jgi:magnesium chelatase family protein